jgi:hypothetical protein
MSRPHQIDAVEITVTVTLMSLTGRVAFRYKLPDLATKVLELRRTFAPADAFFIEDWTFVSNGHGGQSATNLTSGGRLVFRDNTLINQNTARH